MIRKVTRPETPAAFRATRYSCIRPPLAPEIPYVTIPTPPPGRRERITERPAKP